MTSTHIMMLGLNSWPIHNIIPVLCFYFLSPSHNPHCYCPLVLSSLSWIKLFNPSHPSGIGRFSVQIFQLWSWNWKQWHTSKVHVQVLFIFGLKMLLLGHLVASSSPPSRKIRYLFPPSLLQRSCVCFYLIKINND